jgi:hypothetical protein
MKYNTSDAHREYMNNRYEGRKTVDKALRIKVNKDAVSSLKGKIKRPEFLARAMDKAVKNGFQKGFKPTDLKYSGIDENYVAVVISKELHTIFGQIAKKFDMKTNRVISLLFNYEAKKIK